MQAFLFDSNLCVPLTFPEHPFHRLAFDAIGKCAAPRPACFCRATQQSFVRLITTPSLARGYGVPEIHNQHAVKILTDYQALAYVDFVNEPAATYALWLSLANRQTASPKLWMDAYLAAFAISGHLRFVTMDKDFRQFEAAGLDLELISLS